MKIHEKKLFAKPKIPSYFGKKQTASVQGNDGFIVNKYREKSNFAINENKTVFDTAIAASYIMHVKLTAEVDNVLPVLSRSEISTKGIQYMKMNASLYRNVSSFRLRVKDRDAFKKFSLTFGSSGIALREYVWIPKTTGIQWTMNLTDISCR